MADKGETHAFPYLGHQGSGSVGPRSPRFDGTSKFCERLPWDTKAPCGEAGMEMRRGGVECDAVAQNLVIVFRAGPTLCLLYSGKRQQRTDAAHHGTRRQAGPS